MVACVSGVFFFVAEKRSRVWMDHSLSKCSSIEGRLNCFLFGAVKKKLLSTLMYGVLCKYKFPFLWDKCPRIQFLGHMGNCILLT